MLFETKKVPRKTQDKKKQEEFTAEERESQGVVILEKVLCDRCFEDTLNGGAVYKYGSAVYCEKCHTEIEKMLLDEMADLYISRRQIVG